MKTVAIDIRGRILLLALALLVLVASSASAAGPVWMPGFPMRMGPSVMLMWTPVPGATGYNIYKSPKAGDLGQKVISQPANNYMDMNVPTDQSAYYTVKAVVGGAEGEAGTVGAVIGSKPLDPPKITGHMLVENDALSIRIDRIDGAVFYNFYKAPAAEGPFALVGSVQDAKYVDTTVEHDKTYYYQVTAVDKLSVESPKSAVYTVKLEKKKEVIKAVKNVLKERVVEFVDYWRGTDEVPLGTPYHLAVDTESDAIYVTDGAGFKVMDFTGNVVGKFDPPADYKGVFGKIASINMAPGGVIATTWRDYFGVRFIDGNGTVLSEFQITKMTKEEYEKLGRLEDWEKDKVNTVSIAGLAVDGKGNVWVCEPVFGQVHVYTPEGELIKKFGEPRPRTLKPGNFSVPTQLRYHKPTDTMYLLDAGQRMFTLFDAAKLDFKKDKDGNPLYGTTLAGTDIGLFQEPRGISIGPDNKVYVSDGIDGRLMAFDLHMNYLETIVTEKGEKKPKQVKAPMGLVVGEKLILIAEPLSERLTVFKF